MTECCGRHRILRAVKEALTIFQNDPLLFEPGTDYPYSKLWLESRQRCHRSASKQEFLTYLQRAVFEPIGLQSLAPDHVRAIIPFQLASMNATQQARWSMRRTKTAVRNGPVEGCSAAPKA